VTRYIVRDWRISPAALLSPGIIQAMSFDWNDPKIVVAVIAASASVCGVMATGAIALWTARKGRLAAEEAQFLKVRLDSELARINAALAERSAERNARRDYEYDAKKRLYSEIEPLLFQLFEALEEAQYRVRSLARTSRTNNIHWLERPGSYFRSTLYKVFLPAVLLRLIQRQMTFVDLHLDETIRIRYQLLKLYVRSFTDGFDLAKLEPVLRYDPNNEEWRKLTATEPAVYKRQALVVGDLDKICEAMIVREKDFPARALTFSEFEKILTESNNNQDVQEVVNWFIGFSPRRRPILARILIAQAVMAQLILSTYGEVTSVENLADRLESIVASKEAKEVLAWDDSEDPTDLQIALMYWRERIGWLHTSSSWMEAEASAQTESVPSSAS
jgi:hypothetical protein